MYLLGLWGLPEATLETVAYHHRPEDCPQQEFSCLTAVHVANAIDHEGNPNGPDPTAPRLSPAYLERVGLTERIPVWRKACAINAHTEND